MLGSVLSVAPQEQAEGPKPGPQDVVHGSEPPPLDQEPARAGARLAAWPGRPTLPAGNLAWTYMIEHPGGEFALFVGHVEEEGRAFPFEVWVNGAEQPRGLGAVAKTLSMDMRAKDRAWLKLKLDMLAKTPGDDSFEMPFPPHGERKLVPSVAAGLAQVVRWRCDPLGALDEKSPDLLSPEGRPHPVLDAMFAVEEPQTGTDGTMSWTVDVRNPRSGDDFVLGLKEITLPDGVTRPYSMFLAGQYPRALDGLRRSSRSTCACSIRRGSG